MTKTNTQAHNWTTGARTARRSKYARARVAAGLKYRDLRNLGFGFSTVARADAGILPTHAAIRREYLKLIKLEDEA